MVDSEARDLEFQEAREALAYKDTELFDTIILNHTIEANQSKLKFLQL